MKKELHQGGVRLFGKGAAVLLSSTMLSAIAQPAQAQAVDRPSPTAEQASGAEQGLGDIIVTARRRAETLMSVPVAVSSVGSAQLERAGATSLAQIAQMAPQVSIGRAESGTGAIFTIRGIGTPAVDSALEQSVSLMVDGIPGGRGQIVNLGFFDIDRVEVLKGPQALFFGKNSPAGVISLTSKGPTDRLEGYVKAGYEFQANEKYTEAAIGTPITDTLGVRLAIRYSDMRGWLRNVATGYAAGANPLYTVPVVGQNIAVPGAGMKGNGGTELLGRLTVVYKPNDNFDATLKVGGGGSKDIGTTAQSFCFNADNHPTGFGVSDLQQDCKFDNKFAQSGVPAPFVAADGRGLRDGFPYGESRMALASLTMNYKIGDMTLTSVTGYSFSRLLSLTAFNYTSLALVQSSNGERGKSVTQELRLVSDYDGPLNFSVGGYYEDLNRNTFGNISFVLTPPDPVTGRYNNDEVSLGTKGKTKSAFGQIRWEPIERVELAGGVRYTNEQRRANLFQVYGNPQVSFFNFIPDGSTIRGKSRASNWSPEATLSFKPSPDSLIFAAYKTGFKSGGISTPVFLTNNLTADAGECANPNSKKTCLIYQPERSKGFEIGAKTYLANRTVRLEFSAYSYLFSNLQVSTFNQQTVSFFIANAASARVKGLELQGEWTPIHGLRLNASGTYNIAEYKSFPAGQCYFDQATLDPAGCPAGVQNLAGHQLTRAPKNTFAGGATYEVPVSNTLTAGFNIDTTYTSKYNTQEDQNPLTVQKGYWLLNAGARVFQSEKGWELSLIGVNLANKYYRLITNSASAGGRYDFWGATPRPRQVKVQGTYRF